MKFRKNSNKKRSPNFNNTGRTLPVNNYYRSPKSTTKPAASENQNKTAKKEKLSLTKIINIFLIIGGAGLVVFATTLTTNPVIELKKSNAQYYEANVYQEAAIEAIKSNILNRSKLLFQETSFEEKLKEQFPEISQAKPVIPLGGRNLTVIISVSDPFAYVSSGTDTGIINSEGVLVVKNSKEVLANLLNLKFTEPQSNFTVGSRILTTSEVNMLLMLRAEMKSLTFQDNKSAEIKDVLFDVAKGQLEAKLINKPFFIKLTTFNEAEQQVGGAKATIKQLDKENSLPTQYIDVRVPGRAFVL
jgi:hypothetical protein